jgi:hypothetical protein
MTRARRMLFAGSAIVIGLAGAVLSAEAVLRVTRGLPGQPPLDILIEPEGKYQTPDPVLGFRPLPGRYSALFDHRYPWHFTNLPDTTRITRPLETYIGRARGLGIWVFGCSFVQGWGLDDEGTLPWKLQERFPTHDVVNFGVGGYGTLQSLLQFQKALSERPKPLVVLLAYADFHDERNVRSTAWRDANISYARFGSTAQPYARFDGHGRLRVEHSDDRVPLMALRSRSALFDLGVVGYGMARDAFLRSHEVSEVLIQQFAEESRRQDVHFVLAGIWPSYLTRATIRRFAAKGVRAVDISVDRDDPANRIPYDGHPSAFANEQHADSLAAMLRRVRIVR